MVLTLKHDGRGFDPAAAHDGNGLTNVRQRVARVAGTMHLESGPGRGARLTVTVPLNATANEDGRLGPV